MTQEMVVECVSHPEPCSKRIGKWEVTEDNEGDRLQTIFVRGDCKGRPHLPLHVFRVEEERRR